MCQQQEQLPNAQKCSASANGSTKLKPSYSIKRVLQSIFRKQQQKCGKHQQQHLRLCHSLESLESIDNMRNSQMEDEQHFYEEIEDNSANEKLAELAREQAQEQDIYVPVRFARTQAGTFFWTTNLQPVTGSFAPVADEDLLQPSYCYSSCQYPHMQYSQHHYQDRWAQA